MGRKEDSDYLGELATDSVDNLGKHEWHKTISFRNFIHHSQSLSRFFKEIKNTQQNLEAIVKINGKNPSINHLYIQFNEDFNKNIRERVQIFKNCHNISLIFAQITAFLSIKGVQAYLVADNLNRVVLPNQHGLAIWDLVDLLIKTVPVMDENVVNFFSQKIILSKNHQNYLTTVLWNTKLLYDYFGKLKQIAHLLESFFGCSVAELFIEWFTSNEFRKFDSWLKKNFSLKYKNGWKDLPKRKFNQVYAQFFENQYHLGPFEPNRWHPEHRVIMLAMFAQRSNLEFVHEFLDKLKILAYCLEPLQSYSHLYQPNYYKIKLSTNSNADHPYFYLMKFLQVLERIDQVFSLNYFFNAERSYKRWSHLFFQGHLYLSEGIMLKLLVQVIQSPFARYSDTRSTQDYFGKILHNTMHDFYHLQPPNYLRVSVND